MAATPDPAGAEFSFSRLVTRLWKRLVRNDQLVLTVLAAVIGLVAAYGAIVFRLGIEEVQHLFYGSPTEQVLSMARELVWWQLLLAPAIGGLAIGLLIHFLLPDRRPHGVADVIEATALKDGRMRLRDGLGAACASAASIGVGASVGREGPVVHLAATMASWVAQRLRLGRSMTLTLLGCGVASGVAASFNAPIAGVFFALEVVVGNFGLGAFAPVVISGVVGTMVVRIHLGDFPAFVVPGAELAHYAELPAFLLLGAVCALVAISFMAGSMFVNSLAERIKAARFLLPAAGGLVVGAIAIAYPEVIGVGYETTDLALSGGFGPDIALLAILVVAKTVASCISLGSGFGGGVFSPSLCIGALTGAAFGLLVAAVVPEAGASVNAYSIVGMGAMAGAVLGAPISTILIIFELTGDYGLTIAVMTATATSSLIVRQTLGHSFFTWQLHRRGVDLAGSYERAVCRRIPIRDLISDRYRTVPETTPIAELRELLHSVPDTELYVTDGDDRLVGLLSFNEIKGVVFDPESDPGLCASDLAHHVPAIIHADETLDRALERFASGEEAYLPVVETPESAKMVGVIRHRDAVLSYNQALIRQRREERGET